MKRVPKKVLTKIFKIKKNGKDVKVLYAVHSTKPIPPTTGTVSRVNGYGRVAIAVTPKKLSKKKRAFYKRLKRRSGAVRP